MGSGCEHISDEEYAARLALVAPGGPTDTGGAGAGTDCAGEAGIWYADGDGDGYGDPAAATEACEQPSGTVENNADCDDSDASSTVAVEWFLDADADGVGGSESVSSCAAPGGYVAATGDCDDTDATVFPGAVEVCDGVDNDCNELADDDDPGVNLDEAVLGYRDADGDGVGDDSEPITACALPSGYVPSGGDCDDANALASPELEEVCNDGIDNDCDGTDNGCGLPADFELGTDADITLYSDLAFVSHGSRVAAVGDVSGDGRSDVAVGVPGVGEGTVYIVHDLPSLSGRVETDTVAWAALSGPGADGIFGYDVVGLGDVDGDGHTDLFVGDPLDDTDGADAGAAWVVPGPISGSIAVESTGFPVYGGRAGARAGWSIGSAGDANGDGEVDLLIGAYADSTAGTQAGAAYLVSGPVTGVGSVDDAEWVLLGASQDRLGFDVVGDVDLNGDGVPDVVVGSDRWDAPSLTNAGAAMVFYGPLAGASDEDDADAVVMGTTAAGFAGVFVGRAGDLDGSGSEDLLVGATGENGGGTAGSGALFLISGPVSGVMDTDAAVARIDGQSAGDQVGADGAVVPDMNGDGLDELLVGSRGVDHGSGGRDGGALLWYGPISGAQDFANADITFRGRDEGQAGASIAAAADLNGDLLGDVIVGAPTGNEAFVVFGGGL